MAELEAGQRSGAGAAMIETPGRAEEDGLRTKYSNTGSLPPVALGAGTGMHLSASDRAFGTAPLQDTKTGQRLEADVAGNAAVDRLVLTGCVHIMEVCNGQYLTNDKRRTAIEQLETAY